MRKGHEHWTSISRSREDITDTGESTSRGALLAGEVLLLSLTVVEETDVIVEEIM